ncbi:hypothetical protein [Listeria seeligeri]|uniref:hypothetical protein n=1 Tax=Listeria seeligeri TaxID=1640 RepID=UPI0018872EB4|nr:hypothetical protein [Listeria seeligeri]MBF2356021.1 hypothetical protein [Listeria seeligeri]
MPDVKINNVSSDVAESLAVIAKKKGYKSRDAFLRDELEKIVRDYWKPDDDLQQILLTRTIRVIELNTEVLKKVIEIKAVTNPFHMVDDDD